MNILDLSGAWQLTSSNTEMAGKVLSVELPGDNYSALYNAGIIPDPYYGKNELLVQEYRKYEWTFSRDFQVSKELLASQYIYLEATMVDLFCTIRINGKVAFDGCRNQFAAYRPDVKRFLKAGKNTISLTMRPMEEEAEKFAKTLPVTYPMIGVCSVKNTNLVRKPHCSGGWDWGVTLMTCGVYDPLIFKGISKARLDYIYTDQKHKDGKVTVTAIAEFFAPKNCREDVIFEFNGERKVVKTSFKAGENKVKTVFTVENPKLWWPNGYGEQALYSLTVSTADDSKTREIGLRSLEVVNKRDKWGLPMTIRVNGVDIFCKGADWIPCDAFPGRQTPDRYDNLLESARLANMNMVRVWGGGQFEKEIFYELCDRKGIMIWHDMMFSCSLYPSSEDFIENVKDELQYQLRRLRCHASLALWCGDNEVIGATGWFGGDRTQWLVNYDRLNRELGRMAAKYDPSRMFWPSSPCGGPGNFSDGWHNDNDGDMHYWEVWHGGKDFTAYYDVKPRFCSEFGFQSFPTYETVKSYCPESEMNVFSPIMDHHQKCPHLNIPILSMFCRNFRMPERTPDFFYLSQVQQAIAIKTGAEFWRTLKPRCQGTIFWQLNDNWPVASWSSVEYGGKWKQLMYHAKRFYAPVMSVIIGNDKHPAELKTVNDLPENIQTTVEVRAIDFNGKILDTSIFKSDIAANSVMDWNQFQLYAGSEQVFYDIKTIAVAKSGEYTHRNEFFTSKFKTLPMQPADVKMKVSSSKNGTFLVEISADKPVFFVTLDVTGIPGRFSDNSVTLLPGEPKVLEFKPEKKTALAAFKAVLCVNHLRNTYK